MLCIDSGPGRFRRKLKTHLVYLQVESSSRCVCGRGGGVHPLSMCVVFNGKGYIVLANFMHEGR